MMDFPVPANHRVQIKEIEKIDKYLDFANELKKQWDMQMMVILIVDGALGTIPKGMERGLEQLEMRRRIKTIKTI